MEHRGWTLVEVLVQEMRLRNYSVKTIKAYKSCIRSFIRYIRLMHPKEANAEVIRSFLSYLNDEREY